MPNIKSAKKRVKYIAKHTARNTAVRSSVKTAVKRFKSVAESGETDQAQEQFRKAVSAIDKAAKKGVIHPNTAARKKSRLAKSLNDIS